MGKEEKLSYEVVHHFYIATLKGLLFNMLECCVMSGQYSLMLLLEGRMNHELIGLKHNLVN